MIRLVEARRDSVRIDIQTELMLPLVQAGNSQTGEGPFITVQVICARRPIEVTDAGLMYREGRRLGVNRFDKSLPKKLTEGEMYTAWLPLREEAGFAKLHPVLGAPDFAYVNASGRLYKRRLSDHVQKYFIGVVSTGRPAALQWLAHRMPLLSSRRRKEEWRKLSAFGQGTG